MKYTTVDHSLTFTDLQVKVVAHLACGSQPHLITLRAEDGTERSIGLTFIRGKDDDPHSSTKVFTAQEGGEDVTGKVMVDSDGETLLHWELNN